MQRWFMRVAIDLPDALYRELKATVALEGSTVEEILLLLLQRELAARMRRATSLPLIHGKETRRLSLTNGQIDEILFG